MQAACEEIPGADDRVLRKRESAKMRARSLRAEETSEEKTARLEENRRKQRAWYAANIEKARARGRAYAKKLREEKPGYREKMRARTRASHVKKWVADPKRGWFRVTSNSARIRSRASGREFSVRFEDLVFPDVCPVLGIPLDYMPGTEGAGTGSRGFRPNSPSLDRLDSTKGYVAGNVRVISMRANAIKRDATIQELEAVLAYMRSAAQQ